LPAGSLNAQSRTPQSWPSPAGVLTQENERLIRA